MEITNQNFFGLKIKINKFKGIIFNKTQPNFQIIQFTPDITKNPYFTMVGDELIKRGINFRYIDNFQKIKEIIEEKPTLIHFHQLSPFYHGKDHDETLMKAHKLVDNIQDLKIVKEGPLELRIRDKPMLEKELKMKLNVTWKEIMKGYI